MQRCCDPCYEEVQQHQQFSQRADAGHGFEFDSPLASATSTATSPTVVDWKEVTSHATLVDPLLSLPSLPDWVYAFGNDELGQLIPSGRLYVRLICAVNLPAMNRLIATTDPYCTLHCAGQTTRTRIVTNSLNPRFEHEAYFDVLSPKEDKLTVIVYESEKMQMGQSIREKENEGKIKIWTLMVMFLLMLYILLSFSWDQLGRNKEVAYLTVPLSEVSLLNLMLPKRGRDLFLFPNVLTFIFFFKQCFVLFLSSPPRSLQPSVMPFASFNSLVRVAPFE